MPAQNNGFLEDYRMYVMTNKRGNQK